MDNRRTIKKLIKIEQQTALMMTNAAALNHEATMLIKELGGVSTRPVRKGSMQAQIDEAISKRLKTAFKIKNQS